MVLMLNPTTNVTPDFIRFMEREVTIAEQDHLRIAGVLRTASLEGWDNEAEIETACVDAIERLRKLANDLRRARGQKVYTGRGVADAYATWLEMGRPE